MSTKGKYTPRLPPSPGNAAYDVTSKLRRMFGSPAKLSRDELLATFRNIVPKENSVEFPSEHLLDNVYDARSNQHATAISSINPNTDVTVPPPEPSDLTTLSTCSNIGPWTTVIDVNFAGDYIDLKALGSTFIPELGIHVFDTTFANIFERNSEGIYITGNITGFELESDVYPQLNNEWVSGLEWEMLINYRYTGSHLLGEITEIYFNLQDRFIESSQGDLLDTSLGFYMRDSGSAVEINPHNQDLGDEWLRLIANANGDLRSFTGQTLDTVTERWRYILPPETNLMVGGYPGALGVTLFSNTNLGNEGVLVKSIRARYRQCLD